MERYSEIIDAVYRECGASYCSVIKTPSYLKKIAQLSESNVLLLFKNVSWKFSVFLGKFSMLGMDLGDF